MIENLKPGADVWVVKRDEEDDAVDTVEYVFLAQSREYVICSPGINGIVNIDYILNYHAMETAENYETELLVFPANDCYESFEKAQEAFVLENEG